MKILHSLVATAFLLAFVSGPVTAQTADDYHPFLTDKFNVSVGLFWPDKEYELQVDGSLPGEDIDLDEQFNIKDYEETTSVNLRWRFGEKWSLWGQYWSTSESKSAILEEDINWEDVTFKQGTFAKAGIDMKIARTFFGRTFSTGPRYEFGAGLGLHWMDLSAFIKGEIIADENTTGFHKASVSAGIPLPNIGAWYMYSWSPKWLFQARLDWLSASIGDYSGGLWNAQAGIHWQAFKRVGVGLYYNNFVIDLDVDKSDWHGAIEASQHGPYLALTASW